MTAIYDPHTEGRRLMAWTLGFHGGEKGFLYHTPSNSLLILMQTKVKGYAGKILRVDLTEGKTRDWIPDEEALRMYLGETGMGAKILYDEVVAFLGKEKGELSLKPQRILLIGLFGSGKTTSAGKLAKWLQARGLKTGLVACDTHRAAASSAA